LTNKAAEFPWILVSFKFLQRFIDVIEDLQRGTVVMLLHAVSALVLVAGLDVLKNELFFFLN
jgi:hypothetical protein